MIVKIKCLFGYFILLLVSNKVIATEQSMDVIIYNDSVSFLFSENLIESPIRGYPLEEFIWEHYFTDSTKRKLVDEMIKPYSWCLRGYIATWKIRNDSLFLMEISYIPRVAAYVKGKPADSYPLGKLFSGRDVVNGVFANWFSGRIFTVMYHRSYLPLRDDYWENQRKTFVVMEGKLLGIRRW